MTLAVTIIGTGFSIAVGLILLILVAWMVKQLLNQAGFLKKKK